MNKIKQYHVKIQKQFFSFISYSNYKPLSFFLRLSLFNYLQQFSGKTMMHIFGASLDIIEEMKYLGVETFYLCNKNWKLVSLLKKQNSTIKYKCTNILKIGTGTPLDFVYIEYPTITNIYEDVLKKLLKKNWINNESIIILKIHKKPLESLINIHILKTFTLNQERIVICNIKEKWIE